MMYCDHTLVATDDFWHNVEQHPEKLKWYTKNCVTRLNIKRFTAGNGQRKKYNKTWNFLWENPTNSELLSQSSAEEVSLVIYTIRPMHKGNPRQFWILESTQWILDSRYWIPVFVTETWILDFNR